MLALDEHSGTAVTLAGVPRSTNRAALDASTLQHDQKGLPHAIVGAQVAHAQSSVQPRSFVRRYLPAGGRNLWEQTGRQGGSAGNKQEQRQGSQAGMLWAHSVWPV